MDSQVSTEALREDLRTEVAFLSCYDKVVREVNDRFDVAGSTLHRLIVMAYDNGGTLSKHRRKQFADRVEPAAMDFIEERMGALLRELAATSASVARPPAYAQRRAVARDLTFGEFGMAPRRISRAARIDDP